MTTPKSALTPGLAALLDKSCDELAEAKSANDFNRRYASGPPVKPIVNPLQLSLFDYNDAGDATGYNGQSL